MEEIAEFTSAVDEELSRQLERVETVKAQVRATIERARCCLQHAETEDADGGLDDGEDSQPRHTFEDQYPSVVTLDVGGQLFRTSRHTLLRVPSMLSACFSGRFPNPNEKGEPYFIDRSPDVFKHILEFLRDGYLDMSSLSAQEQRKLLREATYYQIDDIVGHFQGEIIYRSSLTEEDARLQQAEHHVRELYAKGACASSDHGCLVPVFSDSDCDAQPRPPQTESAYQHLFTKELHKARPFVRCANVEEFKTNWRHIHMDMLADLDWSGVVVAGGAVLAGLEDTKKHSHSMLWLTGSDLPDELLSSDQPICRGVANERWPYFRGGMESSAFLNSDIDLFLVGLTQEQAVTKIRHIYDTIVSNVGSSERVLVLRSGGAITFVLPWPLRWIQVILRLYQSAEEVVVSFDLDATSVYYQPQSSSLMSSKRFQRAVRTGTNVIDPSRQSTTYTQRLIKYSRRGFEVAVPGYRPDRLDPSIYQRPVKELSGLAKLLVLEARYRQQATLQGHARRIFGTQGSSWDWHSGRKKVPKETVSSCGEPCFDADSDYDGNRRSLVARCPNSGPSDLVRHLGRLSAAMDQLPLVFSYSIDTILDATNADYTVQRWGSPDEYAPQKYSIPAKIAFIRHNPGRQFVGSFNPTDTDFYAQACGLVDLS